MGLLLSVLADGRERTIPDLAAELQMPLRWLRRHLDAGRVSGVLRERRGRHNRGFWSPGSFPEALNYSPPIYKAIDLNALEEAFQGVPDKAPAPAGNPSPLPAEAVPPAVLGDAPRRPEAVPPVSASRFRPTAGRPFPAKPSPVSPAAGPRPGTPGGGRPPAPPKPKAPRKRPAVPPCEDPERVLTLAGIWQEAFRVAFRLNFGARLFRDPRPWESADPKILRRWADAVRLDARLATQGIDPREFCTAIAMHFKWWSDDKGYRILTTMRQVSGKYGQGIWERWRKRRVEEGGPRPEQQEDRVAAAAAIGTATERAALVASIRFAWDECRREGADWVVTCLWPAEVLWLLGTTEPAAREAVNYILAHDREWGPVRRREIAALRANPGRKGWVASLKREAVGRLGPTLRAEGGHA